MEIMDIHNLKVSIDPIHEDDLLSSNVTLSVLRLDKIDPEISGNKIFKLHFYLEEALAEKKKVITFGGAYSNHLAATAAACKRNNLASIGIVRGEKPITLSHTLSFCEKQAMKLKFISREEYKQKNDICFINKLTDEFGEYILIPEGGFGRKGMYGASKITSYYESTKYSHICCPVGTGTTLAGLISSSNKKVQFIGFSALRGLDDFDERMFLLLRDKSYTNYILNNDFHFGGFAKRTPELIAFMNTFYLKNKIPTDFVYTGKMMFGIYNLIKNHFFESGSKVLCIHTGGLQGNRSLPGGTLCF